MVIALAVEADRVAIRVRCGGESAEVTQPVPART
jgi:hypothetical protein